MKAAGLQSWHIAKQEEITLPCLSHLSREVLIIPSAKDTPHTQQYLEDVLKATCRSPVTGIVCAIFYCWAICQSFPADPGDSTNFERMSSWPTRHHGYFSHFMPLEIKQAVTGRVVYACHWLLGLTTVDGSLLRYYTNWLITSLT